MSLKAINSGYMDEWILEDTDDLTAIKIEVTWRNMVAGKIEVNDLSGPRLHSIYR